MHLITLRAAHPKRVRRAVSGTLHRDNGAVAIPDQPLRGVPAALHHARIQNQRFKSGGRQIAAATTRQPQFVRPIYRINPHGPKRRCQIKRESVTKC